MAFFTFGSRAHDASDARVSYSCRRPFGLKGHEHMQQCHAFSGFVGRRSISNRGLGCVVIRKGIAFRGAVC